MSSPHKTSQLDHGGGRGINTSALCRDHSGENGTSLHDGSAIKYGSSIQAEIIDKNASSLLKTKLTPRSHCWNLDRTNSPTSTRHRNDLEFIKI